MEVGLLAGCISARPILGVLGFSFGGFVKGHKGVESRVVI